jgi:uncharacterized protein with von Willebrand factor type A (vWA) domain
MGLIPVHRNLHFGQTSKSRRIDMTDDQTFASLLGEAAMAVWGDMPRDIQEALFETAMRDRSELRHDLACLLHERHPRTQHPAKPD